MKLRTRARKGVALGAITLLVAFSALFVWKLIDLGWLSARGAPAHAVIPIGTIEGGSLKLSKKQWMFEVWIHNIAIGQAVSYHVHHRRQEMVAILRGKARVRGIRRSPVGGEPIEREEILGAGNFVVAPTTAAHQFENIGDEPLWCLVMMSLPFRRNYHLDGAPPDSERDFFVLPWKPVGSGGSPRGELLPEWVEGLQAPWQGPVSVFPRVPGRLLRGDGYLAGTDPDKETWMMLLSGEGTLTVGGSAYPVAAPTWVYAPRDGWSLRSGGEELVALEFLVPAFDLRLFVLGLYDRYQHHLPSWLKRLWEDVPSV